jgi:hypothetical protein
MPRTILLARLFPEDHTQNIHVPHTGPDEAKLRPACRRARRRPLSRVAPPLSLSDRECGSCFICCRAGDGVAASGTAFTPLRQIIHYSEP